MDAFPGSLALSKDAVPHAVVQTTVYRESDGCRVATVFEDERYADLFLAAPDMLAALRDICESCRKAGVEIVDYSRGVAAIAKAGGSWR
jgi:hypothetical protein